jgi:hypothetical protein
MAEWDRNTPWRQGHLLTGDAAKTLGLIHSRLPEGTAVVVVSHDCDLAQMPAVEASVEVVVGCFLDKTDGNLTYAKNARRLHLPFTKGSTKAHVELSATAKKFVTKAHLADCQPNDAIRLTPDEQSILQRWLAARYRRAAFPDEFDRRLEERGLRERLANILKSQGVHIAAIFFDVDEGEECKREAPDDTYSLTIYLLCSTRVDPEAAAKGAQAAKAAIEDSFRAKCCPDGEIWKFIELRECHVISDEAMSIAMSDRLKRWHADYISLRAEPQQPMLNE